MPGILVSIVCATLMSPFSMSSPHSAVAPVDHPDGFGDALKVHRPVERRVTAADDENPLARKGLQIEHAIVESLVVPLIHVFERQLARREGADPAGDQDRAALILILVGDDRE